MNADEMRAFAQREREPVAQNRREYWARMWREKGPIATWKAGQDLREHAVRVCADFGGLESRADDLAHHLKQKALFERASRAFGGR
jgi:hypothetical protein